MWAILVWLKGDVNTVELIRNEDLTPMIFGSCGEAVGFGKMEIDESIDSFAPVLLIHWK